MEFSGSVSQFIRHLHDNTVIARSLLQNYDDKREKGHTSYQD